MKKLIAVILSLLTLMTLVPAALADSPSTTIDYNNVGEVISRQVSLFKEMSSSSESQRKVENGTEFYILDKVDNWIYAAVPNDKGSYDYGWIISYYVAENPTHVILRNSSGVYAYAAPYLTDKRVGTVGTYDRFTVIATTGNYYLVSFRNAVAYLPMSADYWIEEDIQSIVNGTGETYVVNADKTRVYGYSNTKRDYIATYKAGQEVKVLYTENNYAAFKYKTAIAFIELGRLTKK